MKYSLGFIVIMLSILFTSCKSYQISNDSLVAQLKANQKIASNDYYRQFSLVNYPSNNLIKIQCVDRLGNCVWLFPDKNTSFKLVRKSTGKSVTLYFDTVILQNDTLSGLKSRLMGMQRIIPLSDLEKIIIQAEFPRTELCQ